MFIQLFVLVFGFILLIFGANSLVNGASNIAKKFNIPEILIGLTVVALGTSLPELVVTIISSVTGNTDIVIGNVIGSNMCNLLLILGCISIIKPLRFEKSTLKQNLPLLNIITLFTIFIGFGFLSQTNLEFTRSHGIILLIIGLIYFSSPIIQYFKNTKNLDKKDVLESNDKQNISITKSIINIILGGIALKYGGDFVVDSATMIATLINIPERVISLTIVALGTSLPELITSIVAIIKHDDDIAEGNIIGSCIINFCLILGLGATINTIPLTTNYLEDLLLLFASCIIIWLYGISNKDNTLTRTNGIVLVLIYLVYSIKLFI